MKVWVVSHGIEDDRTICGVFTTEQMARATIEEIQKSAEWRSYIEVMDLDNPQEALTRYKNKVGYREVESVP